MPQYVYPNCICVVRHEGHRIRLRPDQRWNASDPFVKTRPELFSSEGAATAHSAGYEPPVEQATAAPGERRAVRRPAKKSDDA
jgi:hypothetical protein